MQQKIMVKFSAGDKFEINALNSGAKIYVDKAKDGYAPIGPNPLELFLSSLGACISVYSKMYLERHSIKFKEFNVEVAADFTQESPARLVNIKALINTDADLGKNREVFLRFVRNCPVHNTIINTKEINIELG